jgi:hypothetical protein
LKDDILWAAGFAGHSILFAILLFSDRAAIYPIFTRFIGFNAVRAMILFWVYLLRCGLLSALRDVVSAQLNADSLRRQMEAIRHANEQTVDAPSAQDMLRKALLKSESDAVIEAYKSPDTYDLPAGNTTWRLSNAISWIAGSTEDAERELELMKIAGDVLPKAA